jgi:integrase/recombinase XerD
MGAPIFNVPYLFVDNVQIAPGKKVSLISHFSNSISLVQLSFARYLAHSPDYSLHTLRTYMSSINTFIKSLYILEDIKDWKIDRAILTAGSFQVDNFLLEVREKSSGVHVSTCDAALKTFYNWIQCNSHLFEHINSEFQSPYFDNRLKAPRPYYRGVQYVSREKIVDVLQDIESENIKCALHFMFDCGVRVSELVRFKAKHFKQLKPTKDPNYFKIDVLGSKGKGGAIRPGDTIISSAILFRVRELISRNSLKDDDHVFRSIRGLPLKLENLKKIISRISARLLESKIIAEKITGHQHRHATAFSLMQFVEGPNTLDNLIHVKQVLRHSSMMSGLPYTSVQYTEILTARADALEKGIKSRLDEAEYILNKTYNDCP